MTPREGLHQDYGRLAQFLRGLSLRFQLLALSEFLLLLISCILLVFLSSFFVLELRSVFPRLPLIYSFAAIITLALFLFLGLRRVVSKPTLERVARGLEERFPDLRDDVTNSLLLFQQVKKGQGEDLVSESLVRAQIRKTVTRVLSIQPGQVVRFKRILNHLKLLLPLVFAFSLVLILDPHFLNRSLAFILHPFSAIPPRETTITLEPPDSILLRHTPVVIRAKTTGTLPDKLRLRIWPENREELRLTMQPEGNGDFVYRMASAQASFRFQATTGRDVSRVNQIRVVDPPRDRQDQADIDPSRLHPAPEGSEGRRPY